MLLARSRSILFNSLCWLITLGIALIVTGGVWLFGDAKTMHTAVLAFGYLLIVGAGKKYRLTRALAVMVEKGVFLGKSP